MPTDTSSVFQFKGISMSVYSSDGFSDPNFINILQDEKIHGFNYVVLGDAAKVDPITGQIITTDTPSIADLTNAIKLANQNGLQVMLKPQIMAYSPSRGQYDNIINNDALPKDISGFLTNYKNYILQLAKVAQDQNVTIFSLGNEMNALTGPQYTTYWNDLISSVKNVYQGKLTYSPLLSIEYLPNDEINHIQFWDKLDFIGADLYPNFPTGLTTPTVQQLDTWWKSEGWFNYLNSVSLKYNKQIIFTESGCSSFLGAANRNVYGDNVVGLNTTITDYQTQANWYQSFFNTWAGANKPNWLVGVFFWDNIPNDKGLWYSNNYDIYGKSADIVVASNFNGLNYLNNFYDKVFLGSNGNDKILLYGVNVLNLSSSKNTVLTDTFLSKVVFNVDGTIINGLTPTLDFLINGIDYGKITLSNFRTNSTYINSNGIPYCQAYNIEFDIPNLYVKSLVLKIVGPYVNYNGQNEAFTVHSVSINNVNLTDVSVYNGNNFQLSHSAKLDAYNNILPITINNSTIGSDAIFDLKPYNDTLSSIAGTIGNPFLVNGNGGIDAVTVLGSISNYKINGLGSNQVILNEDVGLNQNSILNSIHTINFQDGVAYNNSSINYSIIFNQLNFQIYDKSQASTNDNYSNIMKIQFSDQSLDPASFVKTAALTKISLISIVELYIASFNRAPDSVGLDYWGGRLSDGMSLQDIAKSFFVQPETIAAYPSNMPTSDFVTKVYNNVLSRGPDTGGLNYWVGELNNGHVTKDSFLLAIINGAMAPTGSAVDRQTLANKEVVGEHYAIYQGLNNSTNWAKDVMSGVTDQISTVTAANAKADGYAAIAANPATSDLVVKLVGVAV